MVLFIAVAIAVFVRGVNDLLLAPAQEDFAVTSPGRSTVCCSSGQSFVVRFPRFRWLHDCPSPNEPARLSLCPRLWVPKTCATWADAQGMPSAQRSVPGGRRGGLRLGGRAMIFGLWA
jgi:hypothetical protein